MQEIRPLKCFIFTSKCTTMRLVAGSARTRWGSLQRSPGLLAGLKGKEREGEWERGKGRGVQRQPRRRKMRHRNPRRNKNKEVGNKV